MLLFVIFILWYVRSIVQVIVFWDCAFFCVGACVFVYNCAFVHIYVCFFFLLLCRVFRCFVFFRALRLLMFGFWTRWIYRLTSLIIFSALTNEALRVTRLTVHRLFRVFGHTRRWADYLGGALGCSAGGRPGVVGVLPRGSAGGLLGFCACYTLMSECLWGWQAADQYNCESAGINGWFGGSLGE